MRLYRCELARNAALYVLEGLTIAEYFGVDD